MANQNRPLPAQVATLGVDDPANPSVPDLLNELFSAVQEAQGHGFISDGEAHGFTHERFFRQIRARLAWNLEAVEIIKQFLRKYGELNSTPTGAKQ